MHQIFLNFRVKQILLVGIKILMIEYFEQILLYVQPSKLEFLQELLLHVEHREEAVVRVVRRLHPEDTLTAVMRVTEAPGQSRFRHTVGHPHVLEDFHAAPGKDDGAASLGDLQLGGEDHTGDPQPGELEGGDQTRRPGAGDHHLAAGQGEEGGKGVQAPYFKVFR